MNHLQSFIFAIVSAASLSAQVGCSSTQATAPPTDSRLGSLAWLAGTWTGPSGQSVVEEHWTLPRAGTMFGVNRTMQNDATVFFEYLRIEHRADGVYYLASPKGKNPPTPFKLISHVSTNTGGRVVFENQEHDFPQRIVYQREGDVMTAQIEGMRGGRLAVEGWTWQRVK